MTEAAWLTTLCALCACLAAALAALLANARNRLAESDKRADELRQRCQNLQEELHKETVAHASVQEQVKRIPQLQQQVQESQTSLRRETAARVAFEEQAKQIPQARQRMQQDEDRLRQLNGELTTCKEALGRREEAVRQLQTMQRELKDTFAALSAQALRQNNQEFLALAKSNLAGWHRNSQADLAKRQEAIDHMLAPFKTTLSSMDTKLRELETKREGAYEALRQQVQDLLQAQQRLSTQTQSLSQALHSPTARGKWGELQLRRVVELADMVPHCDFVSQAHLTGQVQDQPLRPDLIVRLPGDRCLVVDAKTPLAAYLQACEETDPAKKVLLMQQHARHVRDHVRALSQKAYWQRLEHSADFVVLFLPGESFFSAASGEDHQLIEYAASRRVILASPTTLIALLKAVSYGWRQDALARNVQQVVQLARQLHERLNTLLEHLGKLGRSLNTSVHSYNQTVGSVETRVLPAVRKLGELGPGSSAEGKRVAFSADRLQPLDIVPRIPTAPPSGDDHDDSDKGSAS
ncbi:MAG: DNA recombination protein RmuC [Myxococcota bacterium]